MHEKIIREPDITDAELRHYMKRRGMGAATTIQDITYLRTYAGTDQMLKEAKENAAIETLINNLVDNLTGDGTYQVEEDPEDHKINITSILPTQKVARFHGDEHIPMSERKLHGMMLNKEGKTVAVYIHPDGRLQDQNGKWVGPNYKNLQAVGKRTFLVEPFLIEFLKADDGAPIKRYLKTVDKLCSTDGQAAMKILQWAHSVFDKKVEDDENN
jgi:hypothetical protein